MQGLGPTVEEIELAKFSLKAYPKTCFTMCLPDLMTKLKVSLVWNARIKEICRYYQNITFASPRFVINCAHGISKEIFQNILALGSVAKYGYINFLEGFSLRKFDFNDN